MLQKKWNSDHDHDDDDVGADDCLFFLGGGGGCELIQNKIIHFFCVFLIFCGRGVISQVPQLQVGWGT